MLTNEKFHLCINQKSRWMDYKTQKIVLKQGSTPSQRTKDAISTISNLWWDHILITVFYRHRFLQPTRVISSTFLKNLNKHREFKKYQLLDQLR